MTLTNAERQALSLETKRQIALAACDWQARCPKQAKAHFGKRLDCMAR